MKPHATAFPPVPALNEYLDALKDDGAREAFAKRCRTSLQYIRLVGYGHKRAGESLAINVERESARRVTCEQLRPDVDWAYIRGTKKVA